MWGGGKRVAVIEVKQLHSRVEAYGQLRAYVWELFKAPDPKRELVLALDGGPRLCGVVTNGASWTVYDFDASIGQLAPEQHKPVCKFELQGNPDVREFVEALGRSQLLKRLGLSAA